MFKFLSWMDSEYSTLAAAVMAVLLFLSAAFGWVFTVVLVEAVYGTAESMLVGFAIIIAYPAYLFARFVFRSENKG